MSPLRLFALCGVALAAAGCAIRPLPEDFAGYNTAEIVAKIRCETREALREETITEVARRDPDIAARLRNRTLKLKELAGNRRILHPDTQRHLDKYDNGAIAYDFAFEITEKNNSSADAGLLQTFRRGPFKLGLAAANDRERQNNRNFRVVDNFEKLITDVDEKYCSGAGPGKNWIYPITGSIGMAEMVRTFLTLTEHGNLAGKEGSDIPALADTIEFTTKLTGSANPTVEIAPVGRGLQLVSAGFKAEASREDVHRVIIALTLPHDPAPKKSAPARGGRAAAPASRIKTRAENRAVQELDYQQQRNFIIDTRDLRRRVKDLTE